MLRDADTLLAPAVAETIAALDLAPEDTAAVRLTLQHAATIDACDNPEWAMRWLAPLLLDALEALGATPAARARLKGGKPKDAAPNRLHALRAARRA